MNKKGFMLLETLIVTTILVGVLIFLYIQLYSIKGSYDDSFESNTIPGLYIAGEISEYIFANSSIYNSLTNKLNRSTYGYVEVTSSDISFKDLFTDNSLSPSMKIENIIYTDDNEKLNKFKNALVQKQISIGTNINFRNFIIKMKTDKTNYKRLIIEFKDKTYTSVLVGVKNSVFTITYNANGGTVSPTSAQVSYGETITLPTPTKNGSRFDGWYTEINGGVPVTSATKWTSTQTIYAHWK